MNQIKIESTDFKWSKDFINPYSQQFAHFAFLEGYTFKTEKNFCGYIFNWGNEVDNCDSTSHKEQGQVCLQVLYDDFLND